MSFSNFPVPQFSIVFCIVSAAFSFIDKYNNNWNEQAGVCVILLRYTFWTGDIYTNTNAHYHTHTRTLTRNFQRSAFSE